MQRNVIETVLGAVVLTVAIFFLVFAYNTADVRAVDGYMVSAEFARIDGLNSGADVRISGVKVGTVLGFDLSPDTYLATVKMSIDPAFQIPMDTAAVITSEGLLGGKYMVLEPGSDEEMIEDGGRIEYAQSTPSLEQLLGQVIFSIQGGSNGDSEEGDAGAYDSGDL